ncbi:MAG: hypothetical protein M1833_007006 [Piccolia ochrophora]|nr:MAG: hypothetical protein M1833_007006 [Piccolia ochrophora]
MEADDVKYLLDQLDDDIDNLVGSLSPLANHDLVETAAKLPLLDKAKLYVFVTYAIENVLFCKRSGLQDPMSHFSSLAAYLRLNGASAKEHPVFRELTRVKQYFDKIKTTEAPEQRTSTLDKAAARRFIQPALTAQRRDEMALAEQKAKERARALIKSKSMSKKRKVESHEDDEADTIAASNDNRNKGNPLESPVTENRPVDDASTPIYGSAAAKRVTDAEDRPPNESNEDVGDISQSRLARKKRKNDEGRED